MWQIYCNLRPTALKIAVVQAVGMQLVRNQQEFVINANEGILQVQIIAIAKPWCLIFE